MKRIVFLVSLLLVLMLCACNNLLSKNNKESEIDDNKAYVSFTFENGSRTIFPDFDFTELTNIVIEGDLQGEVTSHFKRTYTSYSQISDSSNQVIIIEPGTWDFNVTASKDNAKLKGSIKNQTITSGQNNTLTFVMKVTSLGNAENTGSISLTVNYPADGGVNNAKAGLFSLEDDSEIDGFSLKTLRPRSNNGAISVTYTVDSVPVGSYRLKMFFFADEGDYALINTYKEIVSVADGCVSSAERTLNNLNELYAITYVKNGGSTASIPEVYSKNSEFLLTNASEIVRTDGYAFLGWYESEDFSGERVTRIDKNTVGNKTFYAKWAKGVVITESSTAPFNLSSGITANDDAVVVVGNVNLNQVASALKNISYKVQLDLFASTTSELQAELFKGCSNISSIAFPDKLSSIGDFAFLNCSNLAAVEIPDTVRTIGKNPFGGCTSLTEITVAATNQNYSASNGMLFSKDNKQLLQYPAGITATSYEIPATCTTVANGAFYGNSYLSSITISAGVTNIDSTAFNECSNITEYVVVSENSVYDNNTASGQEGILYFKNEDTLVRYPVKKTGTSYSIAGWVTGIADYAFYGCSALTTLNIPSSVVSIGGHAFEGCPAQNSNYATVTFNNGFGTDLDSVSVNIGQSVAQPQNPVRNGYEFNQWYYLSGINKVYYNFTEPITSDKIFYAEWTLATYSITYNCNDGSIADSYETSYTTETSTFALKVPAKNGYKFLGWYTTEAFTEESKITQIEKGSLGNITLYAKWEPVRYTITYNISTRGSLPQSAVTSYTIEDETITLPDAVSSKYEFMAWYDSSSLETKISSIPAGSTGNVEVWAGWKGGTKQVNWQVQSNGTYPFVQQESNKWKVTSDGNYHTYKTTWIITLENEVNISVPYVYNCDYRFVTLKITIDNEDVVSLSGIDYVNDTILKKLNAGSHTLQASFYTSSASSLSYTYLILNPVTTDGPLY